MHFIPKLTEILPKFREIYRNDRNFAKQISSFGENPKFRPLKSLGS